jgi:hypothetical protein
VFKPKHGGPPIGHSSAPLRHVPERDPSTANGLVSDDAPASLKAARAEGNPPPDGRLAQNGPHGRDRS